MSILLQDISENISKSDLIEKFQIYGSLTITFLPNTKKKPSEQLASAIITYSHQKDALEAYYKLRDNYHRRKLLNMTPMFVIKAATHKKYSIKNTTAFSYSAKKRTPSLEFHQRNLLNNNNFDDIDQEFKNYENSMEDFFPTEDVCQIIINNPTSYNCK